MNSQKEKVEWRVKIDEKLRENHEFDKKRSFMVLTPKLACINVTVSELSFLSMTKKVGWIFFYFH